MIRVTEDNEAHHALARISVEHFTNVLVCRLKRSDPIRGMHVERDFQIPIVELFQKLDVVWEKLLVPGVSRPSRSVLCRYVYQMPHTSAW